MNLNSTEWLDQPAAAIDEKFRQAAIQRQAQLTKPPGALGRLEELAVQLAAMQKTNFPHVNNIQITVFAADHGIAEENISAFPQSVTAEMIRNFISGGAAINVLADMLKAKLEIINLGTVSIQADELDSESCCTVHNRVLGPGAANFLHRDAMSGNQLIAALTLGRDCAEHALKDDAKILIGGEMGIGNTTSAAALACSLLKADPALLAGPGSGLNPDGIQHKTSIITQALKFHKEHIHTPIDALRCLGGFEIAALTGAYIRCAQIGLPVLVDGYISSVCALYAEAICKHSKDWFIYAHQSAEPGHILVLEALQGKPLLDLGMRLGEGSGAAVAVNLLRMACALHNEMATFATANVSTQL